MSSADTGDSIGGAILAHLQQSAPSKPAGGSSKRPAQQQGKDSTASKQPPQADGKAGKQKKQRNKEEKTTQVVAGPKTQSNKKSKGKKGGDALAETEAEEDSPGPSKRNVLLQEIRALGGTDEDLDLIGGSESGDEDGSVEGIVHLKEDSRDVDPALLKDLKAFMKDLDFPTTSGAKQPPVVGEPAPSKAERTAAASAALSSIAAKLDAPEQEAKKAKREARKEQRRLEAEKRRMEEMDVDEVEEQPPSKKEKGKKPVKSEEVDARHSRSRSDIAVTPSIPIRPVWYDTTGFAELPEAKSPPVQISDETISALSERGEKILSQLSAQFQASLEPDASTSKRGPSFLSTSDKAFVNKILSSGTSSDRLSALLLLVSSAPLHSGTTYLTQLLGICRKKNRDEAGRAMRGLIDWLRGKGGGGNGEDGKSVGGLPDRKLKFFRDQPALARVSELRKASTTPAQAGPKKGRRGAPSEASQLGDEWLALWAFEDWMKRWYLDLLRVIENFSVDTVAHVRSQSVTYSYLLLHDKPEQEQNLLRLLSNKLGDGDRSVASRASYHMLQILQSHPGMKAIIASEVAGLVLKPTVASNRAVDTGKNRKGGPAAPASDPSARHKDHARYYGTITLNQVTLSKADVTVANKLVEVYFELFKDLLGDSAGDDDSGEKPDEAGSSKDDRRRKGLKKRSAIAENQIESDQTSRLTAAILTGLNRAFPFASTEDALLERHIDTLFRIVHVGPAFNVGIQALVLIQHIVASRVRTSKSAPTDRTDDSASDPVPRLMSRFYRVIYETLVDPRLVTSSKQAMYLNLLFKSVRADPDPRRVCAFVKRIVQILPLHQPPFICGALFLLGELFSSIPGLRELSMTPADPSNEAAYDGRKRDPAFAQAESSRLWELAPLLSHFHPSVALNAGQLQAGLPVTASADLDQHTLSRFLERFVYRNPKKSQGGDARLKGPSAMQPAAHGTDKSGIVLARKGGTDAAGPLNSAAFMNKRPEQVAPDELFFHHYFRRKSLNDEARSRGARQKSSARGDDAAAESSEADEDEEGDGFNEDEVWRAMQATMPKLPGDAHAGPDIDDSDSEWSGQAPESDAGSSDGAGTRADLASDRSNADEDLAAHHPTSNDGDELLDDEDDSDGDDFVQALLEASDVSDDGFGELGSASEDEADDVAPLSAPETSDAGQRRRARDRKDSGGFDGRTKRRRLGMSDLGDGGAIFATADDYAAVIAAGDEEDEEL